MKIETNLQDNEPRTVYGVKGLKSKPLAKKFPNAAAMERWLDENEHDVTVYSIERAE